MNKEYYSTGYDYGQGPRNQPPRPAPPPPKCETGVCKDGGCAPFYTLYEKDRGGWRTGRKMVICHTCYYNGVKPQFRGDAVPMPIVPAPGSLHVTGPDEEDESRPTVQATGQTSYSGQQMKTIIIDSPTPATDEETEARDHDEELNVSHEEKHTNDEKLNADHEEKHESKHSTLPGKKRTTRTHKGES